MEQLEFEDITIDRTMTARKVKHFLTKGVPSYQRLAGMPDFNLSSPQLSFAPGHTTGINHEEKDIFVNIGKENARRSWTEYPRGVLKAVGLAYSYCDLISRTIIKESFFEGKSDVYVANKIQYSERQFAKYKQEALCQFAESWVSASKIFDCGDISLLVRKKRKCKKGAKKVQF